MCSFEECAYSPADSANGQMTASCDFGENLKDESFSKSFLVWRVLKHGKL